MYLVLEIYGSVEVGNLGVRGFAEHLAFDIVNEAAQFWTMVSGAPCRDLGGLAYRVPLLGVRKTRRQSHRHDLSKN